MSGRAKTLIVPLLLGSLVVASAVAGSPKHEPPRTSWPLAAPLTQPGQTRALGLGLLRATADARVCWKITVAQIALPATASHLHHSAAAGLGTALLALTPPNAAGHSSGCAAARPDLVARLRSTPSDYLLDVHAANGILQGEIRPLSRRPPGVR